MFDMDLPWWEFMVRGAIVYIVLLVMVRVSGKRTVGQFTPFDLLVVMLLSEAVSNSLSGGDSSLIGGLLIAATLLGLNMLMALASSRSKKFSKLLDGTAVLLGRDGKFFDNVVKELRLGQSDLDEALREADCSLEEMQCAFLEADGDITIMKNPKVKKTESS
ncbi:MAG: YetF domain-containing protein [Pseudomonadota bacterium]